VWLELEDGPNRRVPLGGERGGKEGALGWAIGPGKEGGETASWAGTRREKKGDGKERGKREGGPAAPRGRKRKREGGYGPGQEEKEREKECI
jgi:hypothetical protein